MRKNKVAKLLWRCDNERGGQWVQVGLTLSPSDRELLRTTAASAQVSQMGVLRVGLRLAAQAIAELGDA